MEERGRRVLGSELAPIQALPQAVEELAAEDLGQRAHGEEEARVSRRDPAGAVRGQGASGHDAVEMEMEQEGLAPGVEDGRDAELSAQVLGIARRGLERLAGCGEEQVVEEAGPPEGQAMELVGERKDDVEVGDGEEIGAPGLEPVLLGEELALGAVAVAAGVVDGAAVAAAVTRFEVAAQGGGAAGDDRAQDPLLLEAHRMEGAVARPVPAHDLPEVGRGRASCRSLMLRRGAHAASDRKKVQRLRDDAGGLAHGLGQMEVARRGAEAPVSE